MFNWLKRFFSEEVEYRTESGTLIIIDRNGRVRVDLDDPQTKAVIVEGRSMKTFKDVNENTNKELMRCAGIVRKYGWDDNAVGMMVGLGGPIYYYNPQAHLAHGHYPKEYIEEFMRWQEQEFGE